MENKYKKWTKKEEKFLSENFGKIELSEISKKLQRTEESISQKVCYMRKNGEKTKRSRGYREWTEDEEKKLLELWDTETALNISKILNRERGSLYSKVHRLKNGDNTTQTRLKVNSQKDKADEKAFRKAINKKVVAGVFKKEVKVKLGQPYEIERVKKSHKDWNKFNGKCIAETRDHITIRNQNRAETFLKVDFLINEYKIKEIA